MRSDLLGDFIIYTTRSPFLLGGQLGKSWNDAAPKIIFHIKNYNELILQVRKTFWLCPHVAVVVGLECFNDLWGYAAEPAMPDRPKVRLRQTQRDGIIWWFSKLAPQKKRASGSIFVVQFITDIKKWIFHLDVYDQIQNHEEYTCDEKSLGPDFYIKNYTQLLYTLFFFFNTSQNLIIIGNTIDRCNTTTCFFFFKYRYLRFPARINHLWKNQWCSYSLQKNSHLDSFIVLVPWPRNSFSRPVYVKLT